MSEAVWYVVEDGAYYLAGALLALYVILSILLIVFGGDRWEYWRVWTKGVMSKLDKQN